MCVCACVCWGGGQVGKQAHTRTLTAARTADRSICTFTNVIFELRLRNKWNHLHTTSEVFLRKRRRKNNRHTIQICSRLASIFGCLKDETKALTAGESGEFILHTGRL